MTFRLRMYTYVAIVCTVEGVIHVSYISIHSYMYAIRHISINCVCIQGKGGDLQGLFLTTQSSVFSNSE